MDINHPDTALGSSSGFSLSPSSPPSRTPPLSVSSPTLRRPTMPQTYPPSRQACHKLWSRMSPGSGLLLYLGFGGARTVMHMCLLSRTDWELRRIITALPSNLPASPSDIPVPSLSSGQHLSNHLHLTTRTWGSLCQAKRAFLFSSRKQLHPLPWILLVIDTNRIAH